MNAAQILDKAIGSIPNADLAAAVRSMPDDDLAHLVRRHPGVRRFVLLVLIDQVQEAGMLVPAPEVKPPVGDAAPAADRSKATRKTKKGGVSEARVAEVERALASAGATGLMSTDLAEALGVSAVTIRKAMHRLVAAGKAEWRGSKTKRRWHAVT
jgi:hypothetical protein